MCNNNDFYKKKNSVEIISVKKSKIFFKKMKATPWKMIERL